MKHHKGFTLIELLVVVAIIGILATVVITSLSSARSKARDARRHSDIRQIQNALEVYYAEHGNYPHQSWGAVAPSGGYANSGDPSWQTLESVLGVNLPEDPINDTPVTANDWAAGTGKKFNYVYRGLLTGIGCPSGETYYLAYRLEKGDAGGDDRIGVTRCDNGDQYYTGSGAITVGMTPMM